MSYAGDICCYLSSKLQTVSYVPECEVHGEACSMSQTLLIPKQLLLLTATQLLGDPPVVWAVHIHSEELGPVLSG